MKNAIIISQKYLYAFLALSFYSTANANDPGIHHQISTEAVRQYESCFPNKALSEKARGNFVNYSAWEDSTLHNPLRFRQWHFFSPTGDLGRSQGGSRISMDKRFKTLEKKLHKEIAKQKIKQAYESLGRITHYLQDVTSPAHVMPIYHWSGQKDAFDSYPFDTAAAATYFDANKHKVCAAVASSPQNTLFPVLKETAQHTIEAAHNAPLKIANGTTDKATWGLFWKEDETCRRSVKPKFKDYGPFDNSFGDTTIVDRCDLGDKPSPYTQYCGGHECRIDQAVYQEFAAARHRDAIMASLKALYYVNSKLNSDAQ